MTKRDFHDADTSVEAEEPNITDPDHGNNVIDQRRDLEDFAPLRVYVDPLLVQNAFDTSSGGTPDPGQLEVTYRLNPVDPGGSSLRLFYSNNTNADAIRHVSNDAVANVQATDSFFRMAAGPSFATTEQLEQIGEGLNAYLFEAAGGAYGYMFTAMPALEFETLIEYPDGTTSSKVHRIESDLRDIKQFYTRWDIDYGVNGGMPGTDLRLDPNFRDFATPSVPLHQSQVTDIPFLSGADTIVYVHGWNNSDVVGNDDKAAGAETMLKRLYWQGFRGEFAAFNWPTFYPEGPLGASYNPSEFQAYRSANALKEILADYRGEAPNLQPVHLLAWGTLSLGKRFGFGLMRFHLMMTRLSLITWLCKRRFQPERMAATIPTRFPGRPEPDLYRFWSHGQQDGLTNPNLGTTPYFSGAGFAAEQRINMYNEVDYALNLWDGNNFLKEAVDEFVDPFGEPYFYWEGWPYGYLWRSGPDRDLNANDDSFERYNANETLNAILTLANPQGRPGVNAYEIMAFFAQSVDTAVGTKSVAQFDVNIDLQTFGLLGGDDIRANHSYQLNHDAAETWGFYEQLKTELQFGATYNLSALVETMIASIESPNLDEKSQESLRLDRESRRQLDWFLQPIFAPSQEDRLYIDEPVVHEQRTMRAISQLAVLDAYYERYEESDCRWAAKRSQSEVPESLQIAWESLGQG